MIWCRDSRCDSLRLAVRCASSASMAGGRLKLRSQRLHLLFRVRDSRSAFRTG